MDDKITIIEGPPPAFEAVGDGWTSGLYEGPMLSDIVITRLRTFNSAALIERCHRAWRHQGAMHLEFRSMEGLQSQAPILAARALDIDEGQMLVLWVRLDKDVSELESDDDEFGEEDDPGYLDQ